MADATGVLRDGKVLVAREAEANRIHNKGAYGRPLSGGALELSLVEACHLVAAKRLAVDGLAGPQLPSLVEEAVRVDPEFEIPYFVYSDLRVRGYVLKHARGGKGATRPDFLVWPRGGLPSSPAPNAGLLAVSERAPFDLAALVAQVEAAAPSAACWLGVVDEEGDLTYYEASLPEPEGELPPGELPAGEGVLLEDRVVVWEEAIAGTWRSREMLGKPIPEGLQLSLVEAAHLQARDRLTLTQGGRGGKKPLSARAFYKAVAKVQPDLEARLAVYDDLRRRGLVVKTGFKFGAHYRCYKRLPGKSHAPLLVHSVPDLWVSTWPDVSRAVRLAATVRKRMLFAFPSRGGVRYLELARLRP